MKKIIIGLFLQIFLFFPGLLWAEGDRFYAIVTFVKGEAYFIRSGKSEKIKPKIGLQEEDIVQTKKAVVDLQVGANSIIRVNQFSEMKLSELKTAGRKQKVTLNLRAGQMMGKVNKLSDGSSFTVITPTVTGGVRGTEFAVVDGNTEESKKEDGMEDGVYVSEGAVEVKNNGSGKTTQVGAGEQLVLGAKQEIAQKLEEHNLQKLKILKTLQVMKEANFNLLQEQLEKNRNLIEKK